MRKFLLLWPESQPVDGIINPPTIPGVRWKDCTPKRARLKRDLDLLTGPDSTRAYLYRCALKGLAERKPIRGILDQGILDLLHSRDMGRMDADAAFCLRMELEKCSAWYGERGRTAGLIFNAVDLPCIRGISAVLPDMVDAAWSLAASIPHIQLVLEIRKGDLMELVRMPDSVKLMSCIVS